MRERKSDVLLSCMVSVFRRLALVFNAWAALAAGGGIGGSCPCLPAALPHVPVNS